ncbi:hypothetical protein AB4584_26005 [Vibrio splendidus]|uniref:DUF1127 domain-containing protein n=1 Tax=Vibrio atlanticus TaxID=693153 RepID=A0ABV4KV41_9VIBR
MVSVYEAFLGWLLNKFRRHIWRKVTILISTAMRFSGLVEGLMTALSEKLGEATDVRFKDCDFVSELSELTAIEKAALIKVGIKEEMLL